MVRTPRSDRNPTRPAGPTGASRHTAPTDATGPADSIRATSPPDPTPSARPTRERPAVDRLLTRGEVQVVQGRLRTFGFDPGPAEGIYTAQTQAAVRAYQVRYGLPVSGLLDYATRLQLLPGVDHMPAE
jgi:peptidoglycan hydrolase-like protein with peptidoglycan-binding domain